MRPLHFPDSSSQTGSKVIWWLCSFLTSQSGLPVEGGRTGGDCNRCIQLFWHGKNLMRCLYVCGSLLRYYTSCFVQLFSEWNLSWSRHIRQNTFLNALNYNSLSQVIVLKFTSPLTTLCPSDDRTQLSLHVFIHPTPSLFVPFIV